MFVPSKCLLLSSGQVLGLSNRKGRVWGLFTPFLQASECWAVCPTLQAFFESLAQGGFFLLSSTLFTLVQCKYLSIKKYTAYWSHKPTICLGRANTPVRSRIQAGSLLLRLSGKGNWRWGRAVGPCHGALLCLSCPMLRLPDKMSVRVCVCHHP